MYDSLICICRALRCITVPTQTNVPSPRLLQDCDLGPIWLYAEGLGFEILDHVISLLPPILKFLKVIFKPALIIVTGVGMSTLGLPVFLDLPKAHIK